MILSAQESLLAWTAGLSVDERGELAAIMAPNPPRADTPELPTFSRADVAQHKTSNDCWIILHGEVYNVTPWLAKHPGGARLLEHHAGQDASVSSSWLLSVPCRALVAQYPQLAASRVGGAGCDELQFTTYCQSRRLAHAVDSLSHVAGRVDQLPQRQDVRARVPQELPRGSLGGCRQGGRRRLLYSLATARALCS